MITSQTCTEPRRGCGYFILHLCFWFFSCLPSCSVSSQLTLSLPQVTSTVCYCHLLYSNHDMYLCEYHFFKLLILFVSSLEDEYISDLFCFLVETKRNIAFYFWSYWTRCVLKRCVLFRACMLTTFDFTFQSFVHRTHAGGLLHIRTLYTICVGP